MDVTKTATICQSVVWTYRGVLEKVWRTPTVGDALGFAITEIGEAKDAELRLKDYARNNDKSLSVEDELADCLLMLITALGKDHQFGDLPLPLLVTLEDIAVDVAFAAYFESLIREPLYVRFTLHPMREWQPNALEAISTILHFPDMQLPGRLISRLIRIKHKQLPSIDPAVDPEQAAQRLEKHRLDIQRRAEAGEPIETLERLIVGIANF